MVNQNTLHSVPHTLQPNPLSISSLESLYQSRSQVSQEIEWKWRNRTILIWVLLRFADDRPVSHSPWDRCDILVLTSIIPRNQ